jgi:DNA-binding IclR family transcriptional regulator
MVKSQRTGLTVAQTYLSDMSIRVLLAVIHIYGREHRVTIREAAEAAGCSVASAHASLVHLKKHKLVEWQAGLSGTLCPNASIQTIENLFKEQNDSTARK